MTTWIFDPPAQGGESGDDLDITLRFEGDVTVCVLAGPLCASTAPTLDVWLEQLLVNDRLRVILDAQGLDALSPDGADVVAAHAARFEENGGQLRVRRAPTSAERALQRSGAAHLLDN